jgi:tetratricopeptide (TPR) repeat protein
MKNQINIDKNSGHVSIYNAQATKTPKHLTANIPTISEKDIIGRAADLEAVRKLLLEDKRVVVVNGLGGIGKTTLAQAYVGKYNAEYEHLIWVTQDEGSNFLLSVINAEGLCKRLNIDVKGKEVTAVFQEILTQLQVIEAKPNLWVIDNATANLHQYYNYLPKQPNWHVLATSREKIENFHVQLLGFLSKEKAVELFEKHCTRITDKEAIKSILKTVDYHTLTIEILAKTAQKRRTSITDLQNAITKDIAAAVYIPHHADKIEKVRSYLLSIFDCTPLNEAEKWLMQNLAVLPSEFHTYDDLQAFINPEADYKAHLFAATLAELTEKGWLLENTTTDSYKMHRIIQEVVYQKLKPTVTDVLPLIVSINKLLSIDQTKDNPIDKFIWIPYGQVLTTYFNTATQAEISRLQNDLAIVLQDLGDYSGAKALLEKAMLSNEANFGENHLTTVISYSNLALVLQDFGDYAGAKALSEKVMISDEANFGENHPNTAVSYSNLATVLQVLGDYGGAKALLEKAMLSNETNFGEKHPTTAISYSNLAMVLKDLGDYDRARALLEKAMLSDEANFGENHPSTARCYSNLALILQDLGDYEGAKELSEKAMLSNETNFGEKHPTTAQSYSNLAMVLKYLGDYDRAKALLEKAILSMEKNFGKKHPNTVQSYSNLAMVFQALQEYERAIILSCKAYQVYSAHLGTEHPTTKTIEGALNSIKSEMLEKGWTEEGVRAFLR